ncbi:hypothetical protein E4U53_005168 [Claviceps sorghi]|nr:hypothetical protein E4U53_005168 [Claviceps sorghi]
MVALSFLRILQELVQSAATHRPAHSVPFRRFHLRRLVDGGLPKKAADETVIWYGKLMSYLTHHLSPAAASRNSITGHDLLYKNGGVGRILSSQALQR